MESFGSWWVGECGYLGAFGIGLSRCWLLYFPCRDIVCSSFALLAIGLLLACYRLVRTLTMHSCVSLGSWEFWELGSFGGCEVLGVLRAEGLGMLESLESLAS